MKPRQIDIPDLNSEKFTSYQFKTMHLPPKSPKRSKRQKSSGRKGRLSGSVLSGTRKSFMEDTMPAGDVMKAQ